MAYPDAVCIGMWPIDLDDPKGLDMKITIWQRYDEKLCKFVHNHIEDGVNLNPRPTPKSEAQQVWRSWRWRKYHGRLINQIVHTHFKL